MTIRHLCCFICLVALGFVAAPASAATIYSDDFNTDTSASYNTFITAGEPVLRVTQRGPTTTARPLGRAAFRFPSHRIRQTALLKACAYEPIIFNRLSARSWVRRRS